MYIPEYCLCVYVRVSIAALQYNCEFYAYLPTNPQKMVGSIFFGTPFAYPSEYSPSQGGMRIPKKKVVREGQERGLSIRTNTLPHIHREVTVIVECFFPG